MMHRTLHKHHLWANIVKDQLEWPRFMESLTYTAPGLWQMVHYSFCRQEETDAKARKVWSKA